MGYLSEHVFKSFYILELVNIQVIELTPSNQRGVFVVIGKRICL